jgi:hypothetical protein
MEKTMSFTVEQKSQLARLMATENLQVEHQKISTAKFDVEKRILYLPIWQNMTGVLYDLLCGHEVGHALYTPAEGWHEAVVDSSKGTNYKSFLNVVEDARIEKKIKRRYPGLKSSFQTAYADLVNRDFFDIANKDINEMPFIDRLNLFSKSQWTNSTIQFTENESVMVDKVQTTETWEDVVRVTDEIYEYSKDEQFETQQSLGELEWSDDIEGDGQEVETKKQEVDEQEESSGQSKKSNESKDSKDEEQKEESLQSKKSNESKDSDNDKQENQDEQNGINHEKESNVADRDMFVPECATDDSYRLKESMLLDEKSKPYFYINLPKPVMKNIITPAKRVQEQLTEFYSEYDADSTNKLVNDFKRKNERYVGLLAKEFEMRKAAKSFSKSKLSDTGDIDVAKLSSYKFDDNIFRKVMLTPKGKSHGLVLLLDKSGSMSNNMSGSIEQILVLAMFCRKVSIPFVVYGFGDSVKSYTEDFKIESTAQLIKHDPIHQGASFEKEEGCIYFEDVRLREYINSKMSNVEFTKCLRNMILLKKSFETDYGRRNRPRSEDLSNTPLTQAIYATGFVMKEFRKINNLDMVSLVIVHDGDADYTSRETIKVETTDCQNKPVEVLIGSRISYYYSNVIIRDKTNKFEMQVKQDDMNSAIMNWFKKTTGSKIFGFFLMTPSASAKKQLVKRYVFPDGQTVVQKRFKNIYSYNNDIERDLYNKFKKEKFLVSQIDEYNSFFFVVGGADLQTEEEQIEVSGKVTASKLKAAFMKYSKNKVVNRVLVSKFIEGIAV